MKLFKTTTVSTLGLATILSLSACGTNTPAPTASTSAATVNTAAEQQTIKKVVEGFFDHFFSLTTAQRNAIIKGIPAADLQIDESGKLTVTAANATKYAALMEKADSEFKTLDTSKMTGTQKYSVYLSFLALSGQVPAGTTATVVAKQVVVDGTTASVPAEALTYTINGETYPGSSGGSEGTLKKVNGTWLIEANLS